MTGHSRYHSLPPVTVISKSSLPLVVMVQVKREEKKRERGRMKERTLQSHPFCLADATVSRLREQRSSKRARSRLVGCIFFSSCTYCSKESERFPTLASGIDRPVIHI